MLIFVEIKEVDKAIVEAKRSLVQTNRLLADSQSSDPALRKALEQSQMASRALCLLADRVYILSFFCQIY